jgi:hypothetical protein
MFVLPDNTSALVAFLVGPHFTMGVGLVGWFPLAQGEPFFPWYHYTNEYLVQVDFTMHIGIRCPQWPVRTTAGLILAAVRGTDSTREEFAGRASTSGPQPSVSLVAAAPRIRIDRRSEVFASNKDPTCVRFGDNRQYKSSP